MKRRTVRWVLAGFAIAVAAGVAGMVIASLRPRRPALEDVAAEGVAERELQPVP